MRALEVERRNSKILRESGSTTCGESTLGTPLEFTAFGHSSEARATE